MSCSRAIRDFFERQLQRQEASPHRRDADPHAVRRLPQLAVHRQRGIGMGGHLGDQGRFLLGGNRARPARTGPGPAGAGGLALTDPAPDRGGIVLVERGDVGHGPPLSNGSQGSFTDVIGGVRALYPSNVPNRHFYWPPL